MRGVPTRSHYAPAVGKWGERELPVDLHATRMPPVDGMPWRQTFRIEVGYKGERLWLTDLHRVDLEAYPQDAEGYFLLAADWSTVMGGEHPENVLWAGVQAVMGKCDRSVDGCLYLPKAGAKFADPTAAGLARIDSLYAFTAAWFAEPRDSGDDFRSPRTAQSSLQCAMKAAWKLGQVMKDRPLLMAPTFMYSGSGGGDEPDVFGRQFFTASAGGGFATRSLFSPYASLDVDARVPSSF